jgi:beta-barrel assembly-enhancing protease
MNRHARWLSMVGWGLAVSSCAGMKLPSGPISPSSLVHSAKETSRELSECGKLREDISVQEEYALGGAVALTWVKKGGGLLLDTAGERQLHQYLNTVGRNLAAQSSRPTLRWTFGALQDPKAFDAISAPGGYVFLTRGLLQGVANEAQLAGVLAHEISHITLQHTLNAYGDFKVRQCKVGALTPDGAQALAGAALNKAVDWVASNLAKGVNKDEEFAADALAVRLLVSAGYDPEQYIHFISRITEDQTLFPNHPSKVDRVKRMVAVLKEAEQRNDGFPEWPAGMQGLVAPPLPPAFAAVKTRGP